jgi:F420-non-reducing hydrogenase small subunit
MGANALSAIASLIDSQDEDEIKRIVDTIADPAGTFYRFSLPKALIPKKRERKI